MPTAKWKYFVEFEDGNRKEISKRAFNALPNVVQSLFGSAQFEMIELTRSEGRLVRVAFSPFSLIEGKQ